MKLAIFDDARLGVMTADERGLVDVTDLLPWPHDPDPLSGWWRKLMRDLDAIAPRLRAARGPTRSLDGLTLRAPVLGPSKVIACAINYPEHRSEMPGVMERTGMEPSDWMLEFDVFLKAPSSIVGPADTIVLPEGVLRAGREIHHEAELALVIGRGGSRISERDAMAHVAAYTIGLDVTERGPGDRSRRKSHDTFTPLGPWLVTADEVADPSALEIHLEIGGAVRQHARTADLRVGVAGIVAYASAAMSLEPGDVILTGAPPGVGPIHQGDVVDATITGLGRLRVGVRGAAVPVP